MKAAATNAHSLNEKADICDKQCQKMLKEDTVVR